MAAAAATTLTTVTGQQGSETRLQSSLAETGQRADEDNSFITAVILLSSAVFIFFLVVVVYTCVQKCPKRSSSKSCCSCSCDCWKATPSRDIEMGYIPANITVNQGAIEQGVPDIFLRSDTQSGRFSMEPPPLSGISYQTSRDADSDNETSGTWAEFLRRATLRRSGRRLYGEGGADQPSESCGAGSPRMTSEGPWMTSESRQVTPQSPSALSQGQCSVAEDSPSQASQGFAKMTGSPVVTSDSSEMTSKRAGVETDHGSFPLIADCVPPPDPTCDETEDGVDNEVFEGDSFHDKQHLAG